MCRGRVGHPTTKRKFFSFLSNMEDDFIKFDIDEDFFQSSEEEKEVQSKELQSKELLIDIPVPPWIPHDKTYSSDLLEMLHQEMDDYIEFIKPTDAEHKMRFLTVQRIEKVVHSIWDAQVEVFGSFDTMLYLPSSDVDIVVFSDVSVPGCLWELKDALNKANIYSTIEVISTARVPIIKLTDSLTRLKVDISFNISGGIEAAVLVKKFLQDKQCGHGIKTLMLILKQFLASRHLNEVFLGGLGSYGLLIMITSFLKMHPLIQAGVITAKDNLGVLLIEFFELYGRQMNYDQVGIGVNLEKGAWYYQKNNIHPPPKYLSIMDPQDSTNDVGRGSFNFMAVKSEFFKSYNLLTALLGTFHDQRKSKNKKKSSIASILGFVISMKKEVLEQREFLRILHEEMERGEHPNAIPDLGSPRKNLKRSRDILFVSDSSDDDALNHLAKNPKTFK